jgi:hypothetical protein
MLLCIDPIQPIRPCPQNRSSQADRSEPIYGAEQQIEPSRSIGAHLRSRAVDRSEPICGAEQEIEPSWWSVEAHLQSRAVDRSKLIDQSPFAEQSSRSIQADRSEPICEAEQQIDPSWSIGAHLQSRAADWFRLSRALSTQSRSNRSPIRRNRADRSLDRKQQLDNSSSSSSADCPSATRMYSRLKSMVTVC